jgi:hypothetical protein
MIQYPEFNKKIPKTINPMVLLFYNLENYS